MCGIAAVIGFQSASIPPEVLRCACDNMRRRGPDDAGVLVCHGRGFSLGFAAVRLAIMDPTLAGRQPFLYAGGRYLLAYNGEVYNFRELRARLAAAGHTFRTETDTEVVAAACAQWGVEALPRFNGMFALAFVDLAEQRGFLARDRFGIKPLLYASHDHRLYVASEMSALRDLGPWLRDVDTPSLLHYLLFGYFAAPDTIYSHASRLGPGQYARFDHEGFKAPARYYDAVKAVRGRDALDYTEACRRVRAALFQAVARRRPADVPLGAFLSGGLDSTIVATHLAEASPESIDTFSIGFLDHERFDETDFARLAASRIGATHHELRLRYADVLEALEPLLDRLGEPFFDSSLLPTAVVSRLARGRVTVCLSGDGGDELFGGYWRYLGHDSLAAYTRLPSWLRALFIEPIAGSAPVAKTSTAKNRMRQLRKLLRAAGADVAGRHLAWSRILAPEAETILKADTFVEPAMQRIRAVFNELTAGLNPDDDLNRVLAFDLRYGLPGDMLHKVDFASMHESLEVRVPFLDPDVVELALALPVRYKIHRGLRKRILVDAYRGRLPDEIIERPKMGFELPIGEFLRGPLRDVFAGVVTRDRIESLGILDHAGVSRIYDDHCSRRADHGDLLFALLSLCWWRMRGG